MSDGGDQYGVQLEAFLGALNPDLFECEGVVARTAEAVEVALEQEEMAAAEDLFGVQVILERLEESVLKLCQGVVVNFNPPVKPSNTEAEEEEADGELSKFDASFKKFLPKFQATVEVIFEALDQLNMETARIELEPVSSPDGEPESVADARDAFTSNIGKLVRNLVALEQFISAPLEEAAEPQIELLYIPPPWSTPPQTPFYFEVREVEVIVDKIPVNVKGSYLIGRLPICDIVADDATCSRQHAVVQYRPGDPDPVSGVRADEVYIYDLGSTSGTYVNGMPLQAKAYYPLFKGDVLQFGQYACAFVMRDCSEPDLEPPPGLVAEVTAEEASTSAAAEDAGAAGSAEPEAVEESIENRSHMDFLSKPLDPKSKDFNKDLYKQAMIEKYEKQKKENEEILRKRKEMEASGQAPPNDLPFVPERPKTGKKKKGSKKDKKDDCVIC